MVGIKINLGETYLTIFGKQNKKMKFVDELGVKWCLEFKLMGIYFDVTLSKMLVNYDKAIESVRKELSSWKYRFLKIFGKITVIKTLCLPKLNHIVSVVPNPNLAHLKQLESELKTFIFDNNPNVVDETTRHMTKQQGGLGIPNINNHWRALRMSWFRRSIDSRSTWSKLHKQEVSPHAFYQIKSNFDSLNKAKAICTNPFWKELYSSLITCRLNILQDYPEEYRYIPINGEPLITENKVSILQDWSISKNLTEILEPNGGFRDLSGIVGDRKPMTFE